MRTGLTKLLETAALSQGELAVDVTDDWMQGRSVFGGLQAALALRAMRTLVPSAPLRTLQGTFFAPVAGGPVRATARVLREGKSATHVEGRIVEGDSTLALVIAVFGTARTSVVSVTPRQAPVEGHEPVVFPFMPGVTPNFTQHFGVRWLRGLPPFTGDTETRHALEIDMPGEARATEAHVLAMADFIPPVALSHMTSPAFGSTLTWMVELLTDRVDQLGTMGWRVDAELVAARDGYTSQSVMLWGPGGEPVALSRQSMVVFG